MALQSPSFIPTHERGQQRAALAESLQQDVWDGLPPLYHNVERLRARFVVRPSDPLFDLDRARIMERAEQAAVAAKLLNAVGEPHRAIVITDDRGRPVASSRDAALPLRTE